jgi:hypothetical protein
MDRQKYSSSWMAFSVAFCVALMSFSLATPPLRAQSRFAFPRAEGVGAPRRTVGGATRGGDMASCASGVPSLTTLSPLNNVVTTIAANPTLFWYIPKTPAKSAEFVLFDNHRQIVYQTTLSLQETPGVVKLSLPKTVTLGTDKQYKWKLALRCNPEKWWEDVALGGVIQRKELTSAQKAQLAAAKQPLDQVQVYATAGIWQEALSILAQLHGSRPSDQAINEAWQELLKSVELENIADAPLVECCTADQ